MKKFIEVTDIDGIKDRSLCLSAEMISHFRASDTGEGVVLWVIGDDDPMHLRESYDEIYQMLELD
jgi:hypothetical protein